MLLAYAVPGVRHRNHHVLPLPGLGIARLFRRINVLLPGRDSDLAAIRQSVSSVHDQVENDLLDLATVRHDGIEPFLEIKRKGNALGHNPAQHLL